MNLDRYMRVAPGCLGNNNRWRGVGVKQVVDIGRSDFDMADRRRLGSGLEVECWKGLRGGGDSSGRVASLATMTRHLRVVVRLAFSLSLFISFYRFESNNIPRYDFIFINYSISRVQFFAESSYL